jgi:hypothetical protein
MKSLLTFLAGMLATTIAVYFADGRAGVMFFVGVAAVLILQVALLSSRDRLRAFVGVLARVADGRFVVGTKLEATKVAKSVTPAAPATGPVLAIDRRVIDIQSALVQLGMKKPEAQLAAAAAVSAGGSFEEMLARALRASRKAA